VTTAPRGQEPGGLAAARRRYIGASGQRVADKLTLGLAPLPPLMVQVGPLGISYVILPTCLDKIGAKV
jgi:hypothetical protein